jgi:hypothetical protein
VRAPRRIAGLRSRTKSRTTCSATYPRSTGFTERQMASDAKALRLGNLAVDERRDQMID